MDIQPDFVSELHPEEWKSISKHYHRIHSELCICREYKGYSYEALKLILNKLYKYYDPNVFKLMKQIDIKQKPFNGADNLEIFAIIQDILQSLFTDTPSDHDYRFSYLMLLFDQKFRCFELGSRRKWFECLKPK